MSAAPHPYIVNSDSARLRYLEARHAQVAHWQATSSPVPQHFYTTINNTNLAVPPRAVEHERMPAPEKDLPPVPQQQQRICPSLRHYGPPPAHSVPRRRDAAKLNAPSNYAPEPQPGPTIITQPFPPTDPSSEWGKVLESLDAQLELNWEWNRVTRGLRAPEDRNIIYVF
ncbi:hypothetical protein EXIGLDRAFT_722924 [Exidia glandulosa HHB12029]|uniref:Uncharacterized protein n=1 Tax=Exidia glandulosa HHB12029 TaxID=1314781 RepID=A0A165F2E6_EXIGL|nr:hypothetical protein EXIGLDRAFT_722924 [Exidia glandulosa HHB12029]